MTKEMREMKDLVRRLNLYRDAYYNQNKSLITDREYDALFDRLVALENKTGISLSDSPSKSVGFRSISKLDKVKHNHPLLSLDKTTDISEFESFFHGKPAVLMAKLDGLTCSLLYQGGELVRAESRGDGEIGEDITNNAVMFSGLPLAIPYNGELIVDGECVILKDEFEKIKERENTEYKNPRNLVSGTVRQLNNEIVKQRSVRFIAWKLYSMEDKPDSNMDCFDKLSEFGFDVVPHMFFLAKTEHCFDSISAIKKSCEDMGVPIDGVVGMFDSISYGESLGMTAHHPRHSLAFKFYQDDNETVLRDIEWSTSRTGLVNPVAVFDPVEIDGTTVTRATLNNVSIIKELELGIGDTITVIKANQIIPRITQNLTRSNTYKLPSVCPSCGKPVEIRNENGREMMYCVNQNCKAILHDKIANFASRDGLNIVGISEERLHDLMDRGYIDSYIDLFYLKEKQDEIAKLPGWGVSSVSNLIQSIENSRHCTLANVIVAIGIPGIGKTAAKMIEKHIHGCIYWKQTIAFDFFINECIHKYDWSVIPGIGKPTSDLINSFVRQNRNELYLLRDELDVYIEQTEKKESSDLFSGKTFCITGKLMQFSGRASLIADIESKGGIVSSGVTAKTNYLITNDKDSGSSKNKAAEKYGTKIISEEEYLNLCKT